MPRDVRERRYGIVRPSHYAISIAREAAAAGQPDANVRWIEAWMRVGHSTLDGLAPAEFKAEVSLALRCIADAGAEESEALAVSYGL